MISFLQFSSQRDVIPSKPGSDCAVRERKLAFPIGLDRYIVAQNGAKIVEVAFFVGHGDQPPVVVSGGNFDSEDRGGFFIGSRSITNSDDFPKRRFIFNSLEHEISDVG